MSYQGHSFGGGGSYPSAEVQSVYSTAPADWAVLEMIFIHMSTNNSQLLLNSVFCSLNKSFLNNFLTVIKKKLLCAYLVDFNGISTHLGLFYSLKLGNCVHCTFIFTFFLAHSYIKYRSVWSIDGTLTDTTTPHECGPGSNGYEGVCHTLQNWGLTIRCSLASYLEHWFWWGS